MTNKENIDKRDDQSTGDIVNNVPTHRINNSADVLALFQEKLNQFPRGMFAEFGAVFVGGPDRIDRLLFPEIILLIPDTDYSLRNYGPTTFPELRLLADIKSNELYVKITTFLMNSDKHTERISMILKTQQDVIFTSDLWNAISTEDRPYLEEKGFHSNMTYLEWGEMINATMCHAKPSLSPKNDELLELRELPIPIARKGSVGTNGSYHLMLELLLQAVETNKFIFGDKLKQDPVFSFGNAHIHSLVNEMDPLQQQVANMVGSDVLRNCPSAPDIMHQRASQSIIKKITLRYGQRTHILAMYTFGGIITVDSVGVATGVRWLDLYMKGLDVPRLIRLNDAAMETMDSPNPDPRVIAEQYLYVDTIMTDEPPTYVGDPTYE